MCVSLILKDLVNFHSTINCIIINWKVNFLQWLITKNSKILLLKRSKTSQKLSKSSLMPRTKNRLIRSWSNSSTRTSRLNSSLPCSQAASTTSSVWRISKLISLWLYCLSRASVSEFKDIWVLTVTIFLIFKGSRMMSNFWEIVCACYRWSTRRLRRRFRRLRRRPMN